MKAKSFMEPRDPFPMLSSHPPCKLHIKTSLFLLEDNWMRFLLEAVSASPILGECCWVTWNAFSLDRISEPSFHAALLPLLPPLALLCGLSWVAGYQNHFFHVCFWLRSFVIRGNLHFLKRKLTHFLGQDQELLCLCIFIYASLFIMMESQGLSCTMSSPWSFHMNSLAAISLGIL